MKHEPHSNEPNGFESALLLRATTENPPIDPEKPLSDDPAHGRAGDRRSTEPFEAGGPAGLAASTLPVSLDRLAERARSYAEASSSANTRRAYASDWRHFASWQRRQGLDQ